MANLGTLTLDLIARIAGFTASLDQAQRHAQQRARAINAVLSSIGVGISVAGINAFVKSGIDALDNLNDLSLKTGVTVETLAGFDLIAKQSGTTIDVLGLAINRLSKNIALNREEFEKLGVTAKDPTDAFLQFADIFNSVTDEQDKAALGAKVLGKAYADAVPAMSLGANELKKLAIEGGLTSKATTELALKADEFNDSLEKLHARFSSLAIILAGPIITTFNRFSDVMDIATESGVNLTTILSGLLDFGKRNYFTGFDDIKTEGLDGLNQKIERAQDNLKKIQKVQFPINFYSKLVGAGNQEELDAQKKLNDLIAEREKLTKKINNPVTPKPKDIKTFLGTNPDVELPKLPKLSRISSSSRSAPIGKSETQLEADRLNESYQSILKSLQREIDLRGEDSEVAKQQYEIINGGLKGLSKVQADNLLALANEKDAIEQNEKKWNDLYDIRKSTNDLIASGNLQNRHNEQLAIISNSDLTVEQKKEEFDKISKAYAKQFIEPAIEGTDKLSEYAIQAARNMETAFADFLFDPFSEGLDGMINNFATALRRMAANYLSSELFDLLKSSFSGASSGTSVASSIGGLGGLAGLFGGLFGGGAAATSSVSALDSFFGVASIFAANGMAFNNGNQIQAFTNGGSIVDSPTFFKMSGNKKGLMGEAGPEAIMPLTKSKFGKLGVRVHDKTGNITIMPVMRGTDGKMGVAFDSSITKFANGGIINGNFSSPLSNVENQSTITGSNATVIVNVNGNNNAPDVRRAAAQGAKEGLKFMSGAARYG